MTPTSFPDLSKPSRNLKNLGETNFLGREFEKHLFFERRLPFESNSSYMTSEIVPGANFDMLNPNVSSK